MATRRSARGTSCREHPIKGRLRTWAGAARTAIGRLTVHALHTLAALRMRLPWPRAAARIEVLVGDAQRQRVLKAQLRAALRQLRRSVPLAAPGTTVSAVIAAHHVLAAGKPVAGCVHVRQLDGRSVALIRLALHAHGRDLRDDEVLAVLAEQWIGLAVHAGGPSVVVPTELVPEPATHSVSRDAASVSHATTRGGDPLLVRTDWSITPALHPNGRDRAA